MHTRLLAGLASLLLFAGACSKPSDTEPGWKTTGIQAASGPVGLGNTVAVVDGTSTDLSMVVMDAATGNVRFKRPWSPAARYGGTGVGRPALVDDVVVSVQADGFQSVFIASNLETGKQQWKTEVSETFGPFVCGELVCSEDNWSLESAALVARDPATGETRWTSPGSQTYLYSDSGLLVEQDLNEPVLRSVDPATGGERWRTDLRSSLGPAATPVVANAVLVEGTLIVESSSNPNSANGTVGLDPATGSVKWTHPDFGLCPQPIPEVVVVCSTVSGLRRLNPATGEALWTAGEFSPPADAGPLSGVTGDLSQMLVRTTKNKLVAIDLEDGKTAEAEGGLSFVRFFSNEQAKKGPNAPAGKYLGPLDPVPWDAKAARPAAVNQAGDLPDFIGLELAGMRIFLDAGGNLQALPAG